MAPKEWEAASSAVLDATRCFIDGLRSAPCLKAWTIRKDVDISKQSNEMSLFAHLQSVGVVKTVQMLQLCGQSIQQQSKNDDQGGSNMSEFESMVIDHYKEDDRRQILCQIIYPILKQLQQCYSVLDEIEPSPPQPTKIETNIKSSKSRRKNAAPPPLGMLSLNDYVNVACLLEFAVSISIIPALEYPFLYQLQLNPYKSNNFSKSKSRNGAIQLPKVTTYTTIMAEKRIQALPKPLAGRISKTVLLWGSTYAAKRHNSLFNIIADFNISSLNKTADTITPQLSFDVFSVYQAYTEITSLATSIGHLVLLDRFRPMLLPRHLSDIYLGLFTAERLRWILLGLEKHTPPNLKVELLSSLTIRGMKKVERTNSHYLQPLERALLFSSLQFSSSFIAKLDFDEVSKVTRTIDHREAALACRTLLSNGAVMNNLEQASTNLSIPSWLRMRLGQFLTSLAQDNLQSVVDVFVAYARGHSGSNDDNENGVNIMSDEIMTGAAARLARALCAKPAGAKSVQSSPFLEKLCNQFVDFLVDEGQQHMKKSKEAENYELVRSRSSVAMSLTVWATIQQLSMDMFLSTFARKLSSGLFPEENCSRSDHDAVKSAAAIGALLSTAPSSLDPSTKKKLNAMLFSSPPMPSNADCDHPSLLSQILRLASFFAEDIEGTNSKLVVTLANDEKYGDDAPSLNVAIMTIMQTIQIMTRLGVEGQTQRQSNVVANELLKAVAANALDRNGCSFKRSNSMQIVEPYSTYYAVESNTTGNSTDVMKAAETRAKLLVRRIVVPLTQTIEMTNEIEDCDAWMRSVPSSLFGLVLQLHFSNFSQPYSSSKSTSGVDEEGLRMASTALLALLCEECSPGLLLGGDDEAEDGVLKTLALLLESGAALFGEENVVVSQAEYSEEILSTTSIALSLVVAILELGSDRRSESGEIIFQSMMPSLRTLTCGEIGITELSSLTTELAEMASHAMALIATRKEDGTQNSTLKTKATANNKSGIELIIDHITEAERDLESNQPPIRARGVVTLRHIARSLADSGSTNVPQKSLIVEVDKVKTSGSSQRQLVLLARTLARICLNALTDSESYVYLASIHTLVAISDVCPYEIITMMGSAVCTGTLNITVLTAGAKEVQEDMAFTQEQRIKAVEALIFIIRRRGDGIFLNGPSLLETMLFGQMEMSVNQGETAQDLSQLIQLQTHDYFKRSKEDGDEVDFRSRIGTGGPVYLCEEGDLLRSAAISLVCELASTLHPAVIAKYCHVLVRLALDSLQLESSRPVRRSAALLARELYASVMRDETEEEGGEKESASMMAIAMVCAGEDKLVNALERCVTADDVDTDNSQTIKGKTRLVDPATQSRSKEALEMRLELEIIFEMATILAKSIEREAQDPVVEVVRKALAESL